VNEQTKSAKRSLDDRQRKGEAQVKEEEGVLAKHLAALDAVRQQIPPLVHRGEG
jgi:hypothetical protein